MGKTLVDYSNQPEYIHILALLDSIPFKRCWPTAEEMRQYRERNKERLRNWQQSLNEKLDLARFVQLALSRKHRTLKHIEYVQLKQAMLEDFSAQFSSACDSDVITILLSHLHKEGIIVLPAEAEPSLHDFRLIGVRMKRLASLERKVKLQQKLTRVNKNNRPRLGAA